MSGHATLNFSLSFFVVPKTKETPCFFAQDFNDDISFSAELNGKKSSKTNSKFFDETKIFLTDVFLNNVFK